MHRLALAVILLAVPVAGCFANPACNPVYSATWREPGLFDAIEDAPGRGEAYTLEPGLPGGRSSFLPEGRLLFDAAVANVSADHVALLEVAYRTDGEGREAHQASLRALEDGEPGHAQLRLTVWGNRTDAELEELFVPLVENVTSVDEGTQEDWFEALLEDRQRGSRVYEPDRPPGSGPDMIEWIYTANVTSTWTPERVLEEHIGPDGAPGPENGPGHARLASGAWALTFWPEAFTATFDAEDGDLLLQVDAFDRLELDRENGLWADENRTRAWVETAFDQAGLPAPRFEAWRYSAVVC